MLGQTRCLFPNPFVFICTPSLLGYSCVFLKYPSRVGFLKMDYHYLLYYPVFINRTFSFRCLKPDYLLGLPCSFIFICLKYFSLSCISLDGLSQQLNKNSSVKYKNLQNNRKKKNVASDHAKLIYCSLKRGKKAFSILSGEYIYES